MTSPPPGGPLLLRLRRMVGGGTPESSEADVEVDAGLLDALACGVVVHDARGAIVYANAAAERFLGAPAARLRARLPLGRLWSAVDEDGRPVTEAQSPGMAALRTGQAVRGRLLGFGRGEGERRWVQVDAEPELDDEGNALRVVVTLADATARRELARQVDQLARLERVRQLGEMAGGAAHDVNQSLALIAGHAELALTMVEGNSAAPAELRAALETITRAAMDGGETIRRLQTFGRPDEQKLREPVVMGDLLREVAQVTQPKWRDAPQAEGRPIHVHLETDGDTTVVGVPSELGQVLTNLIFNAVDAMPDGGTLTLVASRRGAWVEVSVTDEGVGMPPEVQKHVFEPFFTTKGEQGTGLGLAQVYSIVEQHDGQVSFTSGEGLGTTFRLQLPAMPRSAAVGSAVGKLGTGTPATRTGTETPGTRPGTPPAGPAADASNAAGHGAPPSAVAGAPAASNAGRALERSTPGTSRPTSSASASSVVPPPAPLRPPPATGPGRVRPSPPAASPAALHPPPTASRAAVAVPHADALAPRPAAAPTSSDAPRAGSPTPPHPSAPAPTARRRVLVVDDEPTLLELAEAMLARLGHATAAVPTAEEALAKLADEPFDALVTDLSLGAGIDGWELARLVHERHPRVRIALATGWATRIDPAEAAVRGITAVLAKPYRLDALRAALAGD